jgi:hypothetical protein
MPVYRLIIVASIALLAGCSYVEELVSPVFEGAGGKTLQEARAEAYSTRVYPDKAPLGDPLPIEIIREGKSITLENRSVNTIAGGQLWLNRQYAADLASIPVGRGEKISLSNFLNKQGDAYPVALFLYPDHDKPLVMADLLMDGKMHKLIVRLVDDWRRP